jgi:hypothetical protein
VRCHRYLGLAEHDCRILRAHSRKVYLDTACTFQEGLSGYCVHIPGKSIWILRASSRKVYLDTACAFQEGLPGYCVRVPGRSIWILRARSRKGYLDTACTFQEALSGYCVHIPGGLSGYLGQEFDQQLRHISTEMTIRYFALYENVVRNCDVPE